MAWTLQLSLESFAKFAGCSWLSWICQSLPTWHHNALLHVIMDNLLQFKTQSWVRDHWNCHKELMMVVYRYLIWTCTGSFFTATTYENLTDFEVFPFSEEPIWILGVKYSFIHGKQHFFIYILFIALSDDYCSGGEWWFCRWSPHFCFNKKLSYRRETACHLPTWRGLSPPVHPPPPSGYTYVYGWIRNPQQT